MDAHEVLLKGLPADALLHLASKAVFLRHGDVMKNVIGLSFTALLRRAAKVDPQRLTIEQSSKSWRAAKIFAHAVDVMGSEEAAAAWISKPAIGLANRKPVDLLATTAGMDFVEEYLVRIEYGVFA